jgi:hypothetical protein
MGVTNIKNDWKKGLFDLAISEINILKEKYNNVEKYSDDEIKLFNYGCDKLIELSNEEGDNIEREVFLDYLFLKIDYFDTF